MSAVCVVGAGYVGLPTAACFAHLGHDVVCTDRDADKVARLARGEVTVHEEQLPELVAAGLAAGRLRFSHDVAAAVGDAMAVLLCLPTPQGADGDADLTEVEAVVRTIAPHLRPDAVVVTKSTMPVGSSARVAGLLRDSGAPDGVAVASNPEFLREGQAVQEFLHPHRVVIGADDRAVAERLAALYIGVDAPIVLTDPASAEMIKYASNAFLATKISFVNELANACEAVGADVGHVIDGIGRDPRIGFGWLSPGPGWGGSCFPKDTAALLSATRSAGYDFDLVRCAVDVNDRQRARVVSKVTDAAGRAARVAVWGLAFKAGTDDIRDSPAVDIVRSLVGDGATVRAYDPAVPRATVESLGVEPAPDPYDACDGADVLVVLTEWPELRDVDLGRVAARMAHLRIVDARNLLEAGAALEAGFDYRGIGRRRP